MALSDVKIRKAEIRDKPYKLSDGGGLFVLVKPNGSKIWQQTGHSQTIVTLRCSFSGADIGNGAQHFGGADDCIADEAAVSRRKPNVCFR